MPMTGKIHLFDQDAEAIRPGLHVAVRSEQIVWWRKRNICRRSISVLSNLWENLCLSWDP